MYMYLYMYMYLFTRPLRKDPKTVIHVLIHVHTCTRRALRLSSRCERRTAAWREKTRTITNNLSRFHITYSMRLVLVSSSTSGRSALYNFLTSSLGLSLYATRGFTLIFSVRLKFRQQGAWRRHTPSFVDISKLPPKSATIHQSNHSTLTDSNKSAPLRIPLSFGLQIGDEGDELSVWRLAEC